LSRSRATQCSNGMPPHPFGLWQAMEQDSITVAVGHIPCTPPRDLPRTDENRRDLGRRSDRIRGTFAKVRELPAQDPAYRPTRLAAPTLAVVTQDPDALDAPFRVRTSVDCAAIASCWRTRYPRSTPHRDRSCRDPCNHACPVVCQRIRSTQGRRFMSGSLSTHPVRRENSAT
jgi:hypothetical protein